MELHRGDCHYCWEEKTVLQAARSLVDDWIASSDLEPLKLPTFLSTDDRAVLHAYCEGLELAHATICGDGGGDHERYLLISRRGANSDAHVDGGGFGQDIMSRLRFRDGWQQLLIKYDARHFMGNW